MGLPLQNHLCYRYQSIIRIDLPVMMWRYHFYHLVSGVEVGRKLSFSLASYFRAFVQFPTVHDADGTGSVPSAVGRRVYAICRGRPAEQFATIMQPHSGWGMYQTLPEGRASTVKRINGSTCRSMIGWYWAPLVGGTDDIKMLVYQYCAQR